ncbi:MAG: hypothetical protein U9R69_05110 [Thermodesulfobacteriota bacterium]|nr:hypothetical protein [Thermodesulfobacteriota bacterium]
MNARLQTQLFGSYFGSFLPHGYGYEAANEPKLPSNFWIFASALILGQAPNGSQEP